MNLLMWHKVFVLLYLCENVRAGFMKYLPIFQQRQLANLQAEAKPNVTAIPTKRRPPPHRRKPPSNSSKLISTEQRKDDYNVKLYLIVNNEQLKQLSNETGAVLALNSAKNDGTSLTTNQNLTPTSRITSVQGRPTNCAEATAITRESGIYPIFNHLFGNKPFLALCDERTALPFGWMIVQRRFNGSIKFNRNWDEYKEGFGNMRGSFWLGLEKLHAITLMQPQELLIVMEDFTYQSRIALYDSFAVASEDASYMLYVLGTYRGTAGDSLRTSQGMKFSTPDMDNDESANKNCAELTRSGWWFETCRTGNLNSPYTGNEFSKMRSIMWPTFRMDAPLKKVEMLIRTKKPFLHEEF